MSKKIVARVGQYEKNGEQKSEYCTIGFILNSEHGEYALLDPTINLAGVLARQNALAAKQGKPAREKVAVNFYDNDHPQQPQQQQANQSAQATMPPNFTPQAPPTMTNAQSGQSVNTSDIPF